jgi:hypothetical protein
VIACDRRHAGQSQREALRKQVRRMKGKRIPGFETESHNDADLANMRRCNRLFSVFQLVPLKTDISSQKRNSLSRWFT